MKVKSDKLDERILW